MAVESLLTFAAEGILKKVASLAAQEFMLAWGFKGELKKLGQSLSVLQDFLGGAAEQARDRGKAVEDWVEKLKDIAHDADNVLDEINYEILRSQVELQNHMKKKSEASFIGLVAKKIDPVAQGMGSRETAQALMTMKVSLEGRRLCQI
ncbi:unnamed protein product [Prunus armeniaca]|uniref:Disease resistance N-terminal domain-containing protein n=1 Tax=Prunus armeniaca TaxID=36596 RepID=A0A6J5VWV2_PRUAR|nr:unnamed protein product [Prunus armeniaca]